MASEQLGLLIEGMRSGTLDFAAPPSRLRAEFDGLLATIPTPEGLSFETTEVGGVPAVATAGGGEGGTLLYFHGGGYVAGSAGGYRALAANLAGAAGLRMVSVDYRLAPEAPFPAGLDDAVAAYRGLLDAGVAPAQIVVAGDSAGGGLALAALLRIRDEGLAIPAAGLLLSPWIDLSCSGASMMAKAAIDPSLTPAGLRACASHYLDGRSARDPLASPLFADLSGLPPLMVQVGSAEILLDDATRLAAAAGAAGTSIRLDVWSEMVHVWQAFAFMLPEGRAAIDDAAAFLRRHIAATGEE